VPLARSDFEDWCHWALAQADELDPIKKTGEVLDRVKVGKMTLNYVDPQVMSKIVT